MKRIDILKRDNLLVSFISEHKGFYNIVLGKEICKYLKENGYNTTPQSLHTLITKIKLERHIPICSINNNGYYWGKTKKDIMASIEHLQSRINGLQLHIDFLKDFIIE